MLGNHREIIIPRARIDRFLQHPADQLRAANFDAGVSGKLQRVGQVFQRIFG